MKQDMTKRMLHVTMSLGIIVSGVRQADTILNLLIDPSRQAATGKKKQKRTDSAQEVPEVTEVKGRE